MMVRTVFRPKMVFSVIARKRQAPAAQPQNGAALGIACGQRMLDDWRSTAGGAKPYSRNSGLGDACYRCRE